MREGAAERWSPSPARNAVLNTSCLLHMHATFPIPRLKLVCAFSRLGHRPYPEALRSSARGLSHSVRIVVIPNVPQQRRMGWFLFHELLTSVESRYSREAFIQSIHLSVYYPIWPDFPSWHDPERVDMPRVEASRPPQDARCRQACQIPPLREQREMHSRQGK